eukprot:4409346-Prymnesium_polylepis.1
MHRERLDGAVGPVVVEEEGGALARPYDDASAVRRRLAQRHRLVDPDGAVGRREGCLAAAGHIVQIVERREQAAVELGGVMVHGEGAARVVVHHLQVLRPRDVGERQPDERGEPLLQLREKRVCGRRQKDGARGALGGGGVAH